MNTSLSARALIKSLEGGEEVGDESRVESIFHSIALKKNISEPP